MKRARTGRTRRLPGATIFELEGGFWEDNYGTLYSIPDPKLSVDSHDRAGVGVVSLPNDHFLSEAAPMHDHAFSSPVFQQYHTMEEANRWYLRNAEILGRGKRFNRLWLTLARVALAVASAPYWDNKKTVKETGK